jgi:polyhydroxyalkanoate synthesis regulator phasin
MKTNKIIELPVQDQIDIVRMKTTKCIEAYNTFMPQLLKEPKELASYIENLIEGLVDELVVPERFKIKELEETIEQLKRQIK